LWAGTRERTGPGKKGLEISEGIAKAVGLCMPDRLGLGPAMGVVQVL